MAALGERNAGQNTPVNGEFLYADKTQQLLRANSFLAMANTVYYIYIALFHTVFFATKLINLRL